MRVLLTIIALASKTFHLHMLYLFFLLSLFVGRVQNFSSKISHTREWYNLGSNKCMTDISTPPPFEWKWMIHGALSRKGTSKDIKVFILFSYVEFGKMFPFIYKSYLFLSVDRGKATNRLKCEYVPLFTTLNWFSVERFTGHKFYWHLNKLRKRLFFLLTISARRICVCQSVVNVESPEWKIPVSGSARVYLKWLYEPK